MDRRYASDTVFVRHNNSARLTTWSGLSDTRCEAKEKGREEMHPRGPMKEPL